MLLQLLLCSGSPKRMSHGAGEILEYPMEVGGLEQGTPVPSQDGCILRSCSGASQASFNPVGFLCVSLRIQILLGLLGMSLTCKGLT